MKLLIKESSWSGWDNNYIPEEHEKEYEIGLNKKYVIKTAKVSFKKDEKWLEEEREKFSFYIKQVNDNSILIETIQPMSDSQKGINLSSDRKEFLISKDFETKLVTPTTDCGDIYLLTLID
jgi:hypothetical protein